MVCHHFLTTICNQLMWKECLVEACLLLKCFGLAVYPITSAHIPVTQADLNTRGAGKCSPLLGSSFLETCLDYERGTPFFWTTTSPSTWWREGSKGIIWKHWRCPQAVAPIILLPPWRPAELQNLNLLWFAFHRRQCVVTEFLGHLDICPLMGEEMLLNLETSACFLSGYF